MGELSDIVVRVLQAMDTGDRALVNTVFSPETQLVDELSHRWLRDAESRAKYVTEIREKVSDTRTVASDFHEVITGDVGVTTFWVHQEYTVDGVRKPCSCPSTVVFRRDHGGAWRPVVWQSTPLVDQP